MVFPGDTVFDFNLILEILNLLLENYSQVINRSIIFYRQIRTDVLKKKFEKYFPKYEKSISYLRIEEKDSIAIVKEISQEKLSSFSNQEVIQQVIPIFIFSNAYIKAIKDISSSANIRTIREVVNIMLERERLFFAVSVSPENNFYDIDIPLDLKILNEKKKKWTIVAPIISENLFQRKSISYSNESYLDQSTIEEANNFILKTYKV